MTPVVIAASMVCDGRWLLTSAAAAHASALCLIECALAVSHAGADSASRSTGVIGASGTVNGAATLAR